ncbi:MAG: hypothetical protein U9N55_01655 [candidate division Zixibacteria bacterium]|nr:hypothetical protein [candidate division Zixibacteria bacterium]
MMKFSLYEASVPHPKSAGRWVGEIETSQRTLSALDGLPVDLTTRM